MMGPCPRWGGGHREARRRSVPVAGISSSPANHRPAHPVVLRRDRGICVNLHVRRLLPRQVARAITRQPAIGAGTGSARETGGDCRISPDPLPEDAAVPCGPLACLEGLVR